MNKPPVRILHVVGRMNRGGVETWLMNVLRNIDREQYRMDFLVHTTEPGTYDDEIRALGSQIIPCPYSQQPLRFARELRRILHEYGPYDVVHSHVHHYSGWVLRIAAQCGVPVRIAHSHSDTRPNQKAAKWNRKIYFAGTKILISRYATHKIGASKKAAIALFGKQWESDPRCKRLYCGIDLTFFEQQFDQKALRTELGLPAEAFVIGHVGRFVPVKNHEFLITVAAKVFEKNPNSYLLLVGDGPLRATVAQLAEDLDIQDRVIFAGIRDDVPQIMQGAMDVFVMPSFYEGLPVTGIEAQAAGLSMVLADTITKEVDLFNTVHWLSLNQPASIWADTILAVYTESHQKSSLKNTRFDVMTGIEELKDLYEYRR